MHLTELTRDDLPDLARGAALLGAGGGGDPYIGRLIAEQAMDEFGPARILSPDDVPDDMLICSVAAMGATNIQMEKLIAGNEMPHAVHVLERYLGERVGALIPAEIGGSNSLLPLVLGVRQGLPVIDADGMGRAFPELQMNSFSINGVRAGPLVVVDEHLNTAIVDATTDKMAEDMTRALAIRMGLRVYLSCFPMTGRQMRETAIHNTLSAARRIGAASRAPMHDRRAGGRRARLYRVPERESAVPHRRRADRGDARSDLHRRQRNRRADHHPASALWPAGVRAGDPRARADAHAAGARRLRPRRVRHRCAL